MAQDFGPRPPDLDAAGNAQPPDLDAAGNPIPTFRVHTTADQAELARVSGQGDTTGADELARIMPDEARAKQVGAYFRHLWAGINPVQLGQLLPAPKAIGGSGVDHPFNPVKLAKDMHGVKQEADRRWASGDYVGGAAKYVESFVPLLGPMLSHWGDEAQDHEWGALAGDTTAVAANLGLPKWISTAKPVAAAAAAARPSEALTAAEQAANAFGEQHGVPLDAATATGSRSLRAVQKRVANTLGGEGQATRLQTEQQQALGRTGRQLAEEAAPGSTAVTAEAGGQGVRDAMSGLVQELHKQAGGEYDKLRAYEADPTHATPVAKTKSGAQVQAMRLEQERSLGRVPTSAELQELRRIREELHAYGYEGKTFNEQTRGAASGANAGHYEIVAGHGGAPVYDDIVGSMEGAPTRSALLQQIDHALETGNYRAEGAKNAIEVAGRRLAGDRSLSAPILPPEAGDVRPRTADMGLAVDVRPVKEALRPAFEQLRREAELVPLMGDKAKAVTSLDRLINGPDHVPLSVADAAASDLKSMARGAEPGLRTVGQGKAAYAVSQLDAAIRARAAEAGPEVLDALEMGRGATKSKYQVAGVLEDLPAEPVKAFAKLTAPKDTNVGLLRRVAEVAPQQAQELGRAKLEDLFDLATERGRFDHVDKLYAEWQKLGPETKKILYGGELVGRLDDFFLLAKRIGENPNPSGTAHTLTALNFGAIPVTFALSKLLYTPGGVQALTRFLELERPRLAGGVGMVKGAAREAARLDLFVQAKRAGLPVDLPQAAAADQRSQ